MYYKMILLWYYEFKNEYIGKLTKHSSAGLFRDDSYNEFSNYTNLLHCFY